MLQHLLLHGVGIARELDIRFAPRLNVLTGDNGLGKTFVLDAVWYALTRTWLSERHFLYPRADADRDAISLEARIRGARGVSVHSSRFRFDEGFRWVPQAGRPAMPGIVLYARMDGGFALWDPAQHYRKGEDGERIPAYLFDETSLWNGLDVQGERRSEGLIRDLILWGDSPRFRSELEAFNRALAALSSEEEPLALGRPMLFKPTDGFDTPTLATRLGEVPLPLASSAVRRIVGLAYLLVWSWHQHRRASDALRQEPERRAVVIFDEPETHLHPKWQRRILPAFMEVMKSLMGGEPVIQLVASTHSPIVLASLEYDFDPAQDQIFEVVPRGDEAAVVPLPWEHRGDAMAWLQDEALDTPSTYNENIQAIIDRAEAAADDPDLTLADAQAIDREMKTYLSETDDYRVNWSRLARQRGWSADGDGAA